MWLQTIILIILIILLIIFYITTRYYIIEMQCRIKEMEGRFGDTSINLKQKNNTDVNIINNLMKKEQTGEKQDISTAF